MSCVILSLYELDALACVEDLKLNPTKNILYNTS